MAMNVLVFCLVATLTSFQVGDTMATRIDINPNTFDWISKETIKISCSPVDQQSLIKKVLRIELLKGDKPIAVVSESNGLILTNGNDARHKASGSIGQVSSSYLTLTIKSPVSDDSDQYTCVIDFLNTAQLLKEERISQNLTEEKLDRSTMERLVFNLQDKISIWEQRIKDIAVNYVNVKNRPVFSAHRLKGNIAAEKGKALIFPDIIMRLGQGYNEKTGVFTVPMPGVYVFHLLIQIGGANLRVSVDLKAAGKTVCKLEASNYNYWGQSSVTGVAELKTGDQVMAMVTYIDPQIAVRPSFFSTFSGYLLFGI